MSVVLCLFTLLIAGTPSGRPQGTATGSSSAIAQMPPRAGSPGAIPLVDLLAEAARQNPDILAAEESWKASKQVPSQVSTLPDPQVTVQHVAVGSPIPFWQFATNDFAYLGFGVSEDLPYPGKLALRGRAAEQASDEAHAALEAVQRRVRADLQETYAQLGAVQEALSILDRNKQLLDQIAQIAAARYSVGQGDQQSVIEAQLRQTELLRDDALRQQERDTLEATIKQVLGRAQDSPDITAEPPADTHLSRDLDVLLQLAGSSNADVRGRLAAIAAAQTGVAVARKDFKPDFSAGFMWQHTAPAFPDYYMFTFGVSLPIFKHARQAPALAEATARLASARATYTSQVQMAQAQLRDRFARAQTSERLLTMYREGLLPQARAAFQAGLASYQSGQLDFKSLLDSFADVLTLETAYWQTLADHESAVARIEQLTRVNP